MADPEEAFRYRQQLREAERAQLYWEQKALERDADNYSTGEYARAIEKILNKRKELDRQEQEWKEAIDPLDFTPDADPREKQDREAVRAIRESKYPEEEPKYGQGKGYKSAGKLPKGGQVARKEAAAEMDAAMASSGEEESEEEEDEEASEEPEGDEESSSDEEAVGDGRARRLAALDSESEDGGESSGDEHARAVRIALGDPADTKHERRQEKGFYKDDDGRQVDEEEEEKRDAEIDAYEAFVTGRSVEQMDELLAKLKKATEFYVSQAARAVRCVEACNEATMAVVNALEDSATPEDDCEKVLARVKEKAKTLRSTVANAVNNAYATEELAAYVEEDRVYVEQQMEEDEEPYARAQQLAAQTKVSMFQAIQNLMEWNRVAGGKGGEEKEEEDR